MIESRRPAAQALKDIIASQDMFGMSRTDRQKEIVLQSMKLQEEARLKKEERERVLLAESVNPVNIKPAFQSVELVRDKNYYIQHYLKTIKKRNENPVSHSLRMLKYVERNSLPYLALKEIIKLHSPAVPMVWLKTTDGVIEIEEWKILEMDVVKTLFLHQKGKNSPGNPLDVSSLGIKENFSALSDIFDLLAESTFNVSDFLWDKDIKSLFENIDAIKLNETANLVGASGISALWQTLSLPAEMQGLMSKVLLNKVNDYCRKFPATNMRFKFPNMYMYIKSMCLTPDGTKLITGNNSDCVIFDVKTGQVLHNIYLQSECNLEAKIAFSPNGKSFVIAEGDNRGGLLLRSVDNGSVFWRSQELEKVRAVTFNSDGSMILAAGGDRRNHCVILNTESGEKINEFDIDLTNIGCLSFSPDDSKIIVGAKVSYSTDTPSIHMIDLKKSEIVWSSNQISFISSLSFNVTGDRIVVGSWLSGSVMLLDANTGEIIWQSKVAGQVDSVVFSNDGARIICGISSGEEIDNDLMVFDSINGEIIWQASTKNKITSVVSNFDGTMIISGGWPPYDSRGDAINIMLWNLNNTFDTKYFNVAQAHLLYRLYLAKINDRVVSIKEGEALYPIYQFLPDTIKELVDQYFTIKIENRNI